MCGRYTITTPPAALRRLFAFLNLPNLAPRWNVAPTQAAPVVRLTPAGRALHLLRWGLIPAWAKEPNNSAPLINARADTVATKPSFREAFRSRRCLVPADGFFEWRIEQGRKQPYCIALEGGAPFAFAGLWEAWRGPAETIESFAIVTTEANDALRPLHERMPVILPPEAYEGWLAGAPAEAHKLLRPLPSDQVAFQPVAPRVNSAKHDDPGCVAPLDLQPAAQGSLL